MFVMKDGICIGHYSLELYQKRLFQLILNAISIGEWELAKSTAKIYHKTGVSVDNDLPNLLIDILHYPRKYSHGSTSVPTPFHLSWLALLLYVEIFHDQREEANVSCASNRLFEFKMFLLKLSKDLSPEQQQDIYCSFKLGHDKHQQHEALISLSNEFCHFLSDFAVSSPQNCRVLTKFLVSPTQSDFVLPKRKMVIAESYMRVILSYIGRLQLFEESVRAMFLKECIQIIISAKEYFSSDNMMFVNAITSIVKIILESHPEDIKLMYCSLIDNRAFLMLALESCWKHKLNSLRLQDVLEETIYDVKDQKLHIAKLLSYQFNENTSKDFITAYQICDYYKLHFLDSVLSASLVMIRKCDYESASELLQPKGFVSLVPLVVLLGWPTCASYVEKRMLLDLLEYHKDITEPTFAGACKRLQYNLNISHQFFIKRRSQETLDVQLERQPDRDIFHGVDFCSVLRVLNELKLMQLFSSQEIIDMLQHQPSYSSSLAADSTDDEELHLSEIRTYLCFCVLEKVICAFIEQTGKDGDCHVVGCLKSLIRRIEPLSFRLETLENLFSLLFFREEHMVAHAESDDNKERRTSKTFLFDENEIKKYLNLLNECIIEVITERFSGKEKNSHDGRIKDSRFDKRVSLLRQCVNDAVWRLELVSGFHGRLQGSDGNVPMKHLPVTSNSDVKESSQMDENDVEVSRSRKQRSQLLSQMLSSSESLVYLCLQYGSLAQAQQVVKMFQLEGELCGFQVSFDERFDDCIDELKSMSPVECIASSKSSQLTYIRSAAAAGLLSSNIRSILNKLLEHKFISCTETHFAAVATCFDLVISGELQMPICKAILDATDELIKLDGDAELRQNLMSYVGVLKTSMLLLPQLEASALKNVFNDKPSSLSHLVTRSYHGNCDGETESIFRRLAEQKSCLEKIVDFMDDEIICTTDLKEDKNTESNPCRKSMNETLCSFASDKLVLIPEEMPRRNYIKTLFRHTDTLARLQLYFKTRHSGKQGMMKFEQQSSLGGIKAVNPFVVLKDDICDIFGRLLFEWSMPPKRLESIAKQVNINLVKVVARNFGLAVPVRSMRNCPDLTTFLLGQPRKVLNESRQVLEIQNPTVVMENLMEHLFKIIADLPTSYETHVGSAQIQKIVLSKNFENFVHASTSLQFVDLKRLEGENEKLCFMLNLHNAMFVHGVLMIVSGTMEGLPEIKPSEYGKWTYEALMQNPVGRLAIDQYIAYQVGQIGILSAFDIYRHILGGTSSSYYGDALKVRDELFEWTSERLAFAPSSQDKRCMFLLTHASSSCPPLKFLKPENFVEKMELSTKAYLEKNITVAQNSNKVNIPKLLHWHRDLFLQRQPLSSALQTASSLDVKDRNILLLKFIMKSSAKLCEQLGHLSKERFSFEVENFNWKLNFNLDPEPQKKTSKESTRISKKGISAKSHQKFLLNEPMKKYLYEASPACASVICMALEKKLMLDQISEMFIESKYGGIKMETQEIFSLANFIEKGILNIQQSVDASSTFQAFTEIRSRVVLNILKCLQVDKQNVSSRYVEHVQSLIKVTVSLLDICGSINMESTDFLVELVNVFLCYGGMVIATLIDTFPRIFPSQMKDRLLCESIYGIRDRLDDLIESSISSGEDALKIDVDHITELKRELKHCLVLINDPFLRQKMAMESVMFYDVNEALEILEICAEGCQSSKHIVSQLAFEAEKIKWFDNLLTIYAAHYTASSSSQPFQLTRWQDVVDFVQYDPEHVSILLIASGAFSQIDFWIEHFSVPHDLSKMCMRAKLYDLLKDTKTDYGKVLAELDQLHNKHMALELCHDILLNSEISTHHSLLLLRYVLENLADIVSPEYYRELLYHELGFKALDRLPESLKSSYWHLTSKPSLILEQLFMNMKVQLAKIVIDVFRSGISENGPLSPLLNKIDEIVAIYAEKSLDVPVFEITSPNRSACGTAEKSRSKSRHARNNSSVKNPKLPAGFNDESNKQDIEHGKLAASPGFQEGKSSLEILEMPVERTRWIADQSVRTCMVCNLQVFSTFNRRHHCRHCGKIACADCSSFRCAVSGYPAKVRVCKQCFYQVYSSEKRSTPKQEGKEPADVSSLPYSSSLTRSPVNTDSDIDAGKTVQNDEFGEWQLTINDEKNREIRKNFCFDQSLPFPTHKLRICHVSEGLVGWNYCVKVWPNQAPSASLCVAIVEQYSDMQTVGGMLLKFCNDLSKHLNSRDANRYHDMDNSMLVGMIEFLLFNAKVKFMKAGIINGVELCDSYMAHVEVLRLLLNSDWMEIPTMQDLTHPESIRRLRDRLVDSERFSLAIDVTGKCGLDPGTVWFAWGLSQLKSGDFSGARENFSKCLTPLKGVEEKSLQPNALYLSQIMEIIETSPLLAYANNDDLLVPLHALQEQGRGTSFILDKGRFDEIMHYLNKYGSHVQIIRFYFRHGLLKKAAAYIRDRKCSDEIFIEDLLLRTFQDGSFDAFSRELEEMDPSLNSWKEYLTKSCWYLSRKRLFNCLYQMQLFLKDYFRAATTCVRFFLGESGSPARSFKELYKRLHHLDRAKKHLETLLKEKSIVKSSFVSHIGSILADETANPPLIQEVPVAELKNHLNTIDLQVKILNFCKEREKMFNESMKGAVPTLFGKGQERADLVSRLLMESINSAFPLVSRVIQDYRLPVKVVFGDCIQKLAQQREYDGIFNLIKMTESTGMISDKGRDQLLLQTIETIVAHGENERQANQFIKMIRNQSKKVDALIICRRLKDAYVEALKDNKVQDIERILQEAKRLNQKYVVDICQRFLLNHEERQELRTKFK